MVARVRNADVVDIVAWDMRLFQVCDISENYTVWEADQVIYTLPWVRLL